MVKLFRVNVNLANIWVLSHDKLSDFYLSSWQRGESVVPMLVVRLVLSAAAVAILTWSVVDEVLAYWPVYLSHWGLCLFAAMMLSALLVSFLAVCGKIQDDAEVPWFIGMYWFLYNQAVCIAIMISALFWTLLYHPKFHATARAFWLDVFTHGFNSCIAVTELMVSRTPVRFLHFYQPLGFGLWYAVFTVIYYAAGGTGARTTPYNPQGNGQVERFNGTLWKTIQLCLRSKGLSITDWENVIPTALHSIGSLLCTPINTTPDERMFVHPRRTPNGVSLPAWLMTPGLILIKRSVRNSSLTRK